MADLTTNISTNAQGPSRAAGDRGSMEQHPLPDQIAADKYLKANAAAAANPMAGVRHFKIRRGGAVNFRGRDG
jgi:hypothetical protein